MQTRLLACLSVASAAMLSACGDTTGPVDGGNVTVNFAMASTQPGALSAVAAAAADLPLDGTACQD